MNTRSVFLFLMVLLLTASAGAQVTSVTNADLEQYKAERLRADREYRKNYVRLGLPSPEELDRIRERTIIETEALSNELRAGNLERERMAAEQQALAAEQEANEQLAAMALYQNGQRSFDPLSGGGYYGTSVYDGFGGYGYGGFGGFPRFGRRGRFFQQQGYYANGNFWPTGPSTPPRALVAPRRAFVVPHTAIATHR